MPVADKDDPYSRDAADEERRYCEELQRHMLDWETDPRNFLRLQKAMLGANIAPIARQR